MVARDRDEEGESRRGSRRPRDEDEVEYTVRERRQGRTRKNVSRREGDRERRRCAVPIREGFEKRRLRRGWTRGAGPKNLDLYLDLSKERVVRYVGERARRVRADSPRWRTHTEGARRYANVNFTIKAAD